MSGNLDQAFSVLAIESQMLDNDSVPALVKALAKTDIELTAADGIIIEPEFTAACDRLGIFREAFWQVFPFGDADHAGAYSSNDTVGITVLESDEMPGWIVEFRDLESMDDDAQAWQFEATDELATALIDATPEITIDGVSELVESLKPTKQLHH